MSGEGEAAEDTYFYSDKSPVVDLE